ncbi:MULTISPECIES: PRC-barrel domain-containing protein [Saccharopolyspora]|uniref:PRC-barrel domain-containing protein n=1 Tax=Saccharopolyspora gregorii TaxID=33914 RepID=A0ABP6S0H8_9PSEU|nr:MULTISPECIES: PRC-barrel domain-containing protein [Saccharopolyspora]MCA1188918.1 PRC-barrel domain-containing protein [Saccharopolyspora sp. 6T]MCA1192947.1 PRC-barrel domain-containing protein [Saccharopolyspora sp. 6V]MCA1226775.1 PRC-barrel domain-containing protein [Saccharopolyspora sp. 6M]MCA1282042.1 PRC-barrel domain-containing protein [Saccharopolyspora sp. 7B]
MIGQREALHLFGCEVFDPAGHRIGIVGQLFLDETTEQPAWITVQTGLFGTNESFVPLEGAAFDGDTLTVSVLKDTVRHAPHVRLDDGDLLLEQEHALYLYYGLEYGVAPAEPAAPDADQVVAEGELPQEYVEAVRLKLRRWVAAT